MAQNLFTLLQSPALVLSNVVDANHTLFREPPVHRVPFPVAWSDCTPPESPWEQQVPANSRLCSQHLLAVTFQGVLWWCCSSSREGEGLIHDCGEFPFPSLPIPGINAGNPVHSSSWALLWRLQAEPVRSSKRTASSQVG